MSGKKGCEAKSKSDAAKSIANTEIVYTNKCPSSSFLPFFMFVDKISSHIGLERNPNIAEFKGNFVAALSEIELFEGADLAVMFTHFVFVVIATNYLSWLFTKIIVAKYMMDTCNNYRVNRAQSC